ncbi:MAG: NAD-dependent succinate-semialdehyde dehydrogenase [Ignavibacteria bacterium]|nr:NAD-dependent succinate-semialdehyde dehydrogenase [Ignavibacteria bacterium]
MQVFQNTNPTDGSSLASFPSHSITEIQQRILSTHHAFEDWSRLEITDRSHYLHVIANLLLERSDTFATLMALEMGKPLAHGKAEAEKCALACRYFADHAPQMLADEHIPTEFTQSYVSYRPLGTVLAIMPWNFPLWQVFRFAAPALMAGNAILLKPAPNTFGCAQAIEQLIIDSGVPQRIFTNIYAEVRHIPAVIRSPYIQAVTFTGSTKAGMSVAKHAGAALKKSVLELGGSDAYLILEDADIGQAVESCVTSRCINSGQSCIAAKRFIVPRTILSQVEELFLQKLSTKRFGSPFDPTTDLGPLARHDLRNALHSQVEHSITAGAKLLLGGTIPDHPGAFYPPTLLTNVTPSMPAYHEELFGPVAAIIPADSEADAIRIANDSVYGLGAAVFTQDSARGEVIARSLINAGTCYVNDYVKSDVRLPFGGIKHSGFGRELSTLGIREFVNAKTVCVR